MNTPTNCSCCGDIYAIDRMTRDAEGYWYCPTCEAARLAHALDCIRRLKSRRKSGFGPSYPSPVGGSAPRSY